MIRPDKLFPDVPDAASLWTYVSSRPLSQSEDAALDSVLSEFFRTWTSHERLVSGESLLLESRFLLIAAHISDGDISGCGIDKSTRMLEDFALANEFEWHDGWMFIIGERTVWFRSHPDPHSERPCGQVR